MRHCTAPPCSSTLEMMTDDTYGTTALAKPAASIGAGCADQEATLTKPATCTGVG